MNLTDEDRDRIRAKQDKILAYAKKHYCEDYRTIVLFSGTTHPTMKELEAKIFPEYELLMDTLMSELGIGGE